MSSLQLAYAPSAFAERTSEQDTKLSRLDTNIKVVCHQRSGARKRTKTPTTFLSRYI
jgi:hypothetical protein